MDARALLRIRGVAREGRRAQGAGRRARAGREAIHAAPRTTIAIRLLTQNDQTEVIWGNIIQPRNQRAKNKLLRVIQGVPFEAHSKIRFVDSVPFWNGSENDVQTSNDLH